MLKSTGHRWMYAWGKFESQQQLFAVSEFIVTVMVKSVKGRCYCKSWEQIWGEEKRTGAISLGQARLAGRMLGTKGREVECWQPNYSSPRAQWLSLERISTASQWTGWHGSVTGCRRTDVCVHLCVNGGVLSKLSGGRCKYSSRLRAVNSNCF